MRPPRPRHREGVAGIELEVAGVVVQIAAVLGALKATT